MAGRDTYGAGFATLDEWIAQLRAAASPAAPAAIAQQLVPVVRAEIDQAIREQRSVDGTPWPPTKDGHAALQNAMKAVTVSAIRSTILIRLSGPEVFHHFGTHRVPARPILPRGGMPDRLGNAIRRGVVAACAAFLARKGRGRGGPAISPSMRGG
jgi:hypothetical protein